MPDYMRDGGIGYEEDVDWFKLPEGYTFTEAAGVAVDPQDNVYAIVRGDHPILVFDKDGKFLRSFGEGEFGPRSHAISYSPDGFLYAIDESQHAIQKLTLEGEHVMTLGNKGQAAEQWSNKPFNRPTHIAVSTRTAELFVSDGYANGAVHRFSPEGKHILSWGSAGSEPGQFLIPHNVVVDEDDHVYVADRLNHRVQVFNPDGKLLDTWGSIYTANAIAMDSEGTMYVGELNGSYSDLILGHHFYLYSKKGERLARLGAPDWGDNPDQFTAVHGCAVDSQKNLYVAEVSYTMRGRREDPPKTYRSLRRFHRAG
jgi:DNA-binding beta-propeller fold protein YncE